MTEVRTLEEDFLDSPEKFGALISFYGVLLRKLKEEATGIEILHHIATLDPDLYKMMRVEESPKISPSMAKYIIETLKRRALKAGTKPLNIFANEKKTRFKTRYKEIIEFLERLYKYAIKTRRECRAEFYRSKIRSLKRLKESKKIEEGRKEGRKEEEEKVEYGKKLERIKREFEDLLKQELKKHLNDKENEEIKSTIETYIRMLVFKKIYQIGVYPPDLHQIEKRIRNDFLIPDSIPIFFKEEIKQKTERSHYDILLVDDDPYTLRLLMAYFESQGVTCQGVTNGTKALEELSRSAPKLILLDIILPDISGYEICKKIKLDKKLKDVPVFYITAIPESEVSKRFKETGAEGYLRQPFKLSDFDRILDLLGSNPCQYFINETCKKFIITIYSLAF
ncbi:MAG: response regulator [Candidatus Lokiarchaeota archaeon]|nr:response regulator [Candidatus Lokiarchaeota archaeon]